MNFFIGLDNPSHAWPFRQRMISVNRIRDRKSEYVGGRLDVRSMEGMIQNIAQDCANAIRVKVKATAVLNLIPRQKMRLVCKAWPKSP